MISQLPYRGVLGGRGIDLGDPHALLTESARAGHLHAAPVKNRDEYFFSVIRALPALRQHKHQITGPRMAAFGAGKSIVQSRVLAAR